ncbi:hypothetical protein ACFV9W_31805 [Streptomyces sp. NPDC059897]|uniref:hypothetical protein n=1 Tax=Streptomyces sp. NPDC059897 TaxID=3346994 RepID=UPI00365DE3FD
MPGTLPVPLICDVPPGWQSAPPEEVGAPQAAFVALHVASRGSGFVPNITVTGRLHESGATQPPTPTPDRLAEQSMRRLRESVGPVTLVRRTDVGQDTVPGLARATDGVVQNLRVHAQFDGHPVQLAQSQVLLLIEDANRSDLAAEIEIALTARSDQLDDVLPDFQRFLRTVRPAEENE